MIEGGFERSVLTVSRGLLGVVMVRRLPTAGVTLDLLDTVGIVRIARDGRGVTRAMQSLTGTAPSVHDRHMPGAPELTLRLPLVDPRMEARGGIQR